MRRMIWRVEYSVITLCLAALVSCGDRVVDEAFSELLLSFPPVEDLYTKASGLPDTDRFILSIIDSDGNSVYEGLYGERPDKIVVKRGVCKISVFSHLFEVPAFSAPCWGDIKEVNADKNLVKVDLVCRQINAGLSVRYTEGFKESYQDSYLLLKGEGGELIHNYSEKRVAFFLPGRVDLLIKDADSESKILAREIEKGQILTVTLDSRIENGESSISVELDTSRRWLHEFIVIGEEPDGSSKDMALRTDMLHNWTGDKDLWVVGYIVGGDNSSSSTKFEPPFTSETNISISISPDVKERVKCVNVELKTTAAKEQLGLKSNPDNIGAKVYLRGDIESSYFGLTGIKSVKEFVLEK